MLCSIPNVREEARFPAARVQPGALFGFPSPPLPESEADPDRSRGVARLKGTARPDRDRLSSLLDPASLFAEFQPLVRRLIRRYGGEDRELCQDLSGEIYRRFWDLLNAYDPARGVPLRAYLVRQLTTSVHVYVRRQWRAQRREVSLERIGSMSRWERAADPTPEWLESLVREQVCAALPGLIARLPERQRRVVIWRYYEQRSFEEIATRSGVQVTTARSLLRHGLNHLRRWLAEADRD